ncbi:hypothetical protein HNQ59_002966 [Chitinivorax tropicus]|uniref:Uncharacterized protein n=1 Tax=Chitinivorax tropicus TaxID=714531 RepID=A0A840MLZ5_9PROT|nr:hypothetical protein [Chitinivorax tropicus]
MVYHGQKRNNRLSPISINPCRGAASTHSTARRARAEDRQKSPLIAFKTHAVQGYTMMIAWPRPPRRQTSCFDFTKSPRLKFALVCFGLWSC